MKITSNKSNYFYLTFQSGLTNEIIEKSKNVNIKAVQNNLLNHNIESNLNSQVIAFAVQEVFAETFTKLICDSLSAKSLPKENPLDRLTTLPQEFLVILAKLFKF